MTKNIGSIQTEVHRLLRGLCGTIFLLIALAGCGGGGGGAAEPPSDPDRVGKGWITIVAPQTITDSSTGFLQGKAFISPTHWRCCTGSPTDTGVTVTWSNTTTGASGDASQTPIYEWLFGYFLIDHQWRASIPLAVGRNAIAVTAVDADGNLGRATITVTRTPDTAPPSVSTTSPDDGASNVGTNTAISVTFDEAMNPALISSATFLLIDSLNNPVSGSVTYANSVATFTPVTDLQEMTTYTATITTGARDIAGNALAAPYVWSFGTGVAPDVVAPTVDVTSPSNGAICVPTETDVAVTFSEPASSASVNTNTFLLRDSLNNPVSGRVGFDFNGIAHFEPTDALVSSSTYIGTITTGVRDLSGNHFSTDYNWTFTTEAAGAGMWIATSTIGSPSPRNGHTVVWTGSEVIVWGGSRNGIYPDDGARYDPATDTWLPVSTVNAPEARGGHVAVWTGSKMIVWGGVRPGAFLNSGAIYDPATDAWTSMPLSGAPSARANPTAIWTGSEMIVWGGTGSGGNPAAGGGRYNPSTNSWSPVSPNGAPTARQAHSAIWTGSAMLVWGGANGTERLDDGGMYTPSSDSWTAITTSGAPAARTSHSAVWTGAEMIVWGGYDGHVGLNTGARYNPASNTWQPMASACAPLGRYAHTSIWTGAEMIVWGGAPYYRVGARYNPSTDMWQPTPIDNAPGARQVHEAIWTGTEMIVWGGWDVDATSLNSGGRYKP